MKGHDLYSDNVALLYRHFGEYRTKSQYFMTPLPFEVRYELSTGRKKQLMVLRPVKSPSLLGRCSSAGATPPNCSGSALLQGMP